MERHIGVRFVYGDEPGEARRPAASELSAAMLAALPAEWLERFRQALGALDIDQMLALIGESRGAHPGVADSLEEMVNQFAFERLTRLLDEAGG